MNRNKLVNWNCHPTIWSVCHIRGFEYLLREKISNSCLISHIIEFFNRFEKHHFHFMWPSSYSIDTHIMHSTFIWGRDDVYYNRRWWLEMDWFIAYSRSWESWRVAAICKQRSFRVLFISQSPWSSQLRTATLFSGSSEWRPIDKFSYNLFVISSMQKW